MEFKRLPSNSEEILLNIINSDNPVEYLCDLFEKASPKRDDELRAILRELRQEGYIDVKWASGVPFFITLNNSAKVYKKQFAAEMVPKFHQSFSQKEEKTMVFISHRSIDKEVADILVDFFASTGISRNKIFCSSLPGNDINEKISNEVKAALKSSAINIAILSYEYYQSAYCLNEAGILWYKETSVIPIALPEINSNNMYGFLNNEYKLRRLDSDTDISYIYDAVSEATSAPQVKVSVITYENNKLKNRYRALLKTRESSNMNNSTTATFSTSEITTDDERVVLYYILRKNVRKVSKGDVVDWLHKNEIYNINVDNAFDLLSSFDGGKVINNTLEIGFDTFREYSANSDSLIFELKQYVDSHIKLSVNNFKSLWESDSIDDLIKLFIVYIIDEKMCRFGDRWMADGQIESIKNWELKHTLNSSLSDNYGSCLQYFIENDFVYESDWTSYGNPREYSLCISLRDFLFNCPEEYSNELYRIKNMNQLSLPF